MKSNNSDSFETKKNNMMQEQENFFLKEDISNLQNFSLNISEPSRRLNDYDFNILQEDAYKEVNDELFKLEYKLARLEEEIKKIESQIFVAREIGDYNFILELNNRKKYLEEDLANALSTYNQKSFSAKISGSFSNIINNNTRNKYKVFQAKFSNFIDIIVSKLPKSITSALKLRKSLTTLETLNKSVDDLVSTNIPYGENFNKYEQLSKYIIKANSIQAEISKYIKK